MRIIPFEIEINKFWASDGIFEIRVLHFDWCDGDAYLLQIGIDGLNYGKKQFVFDCLFFGFIKWKYEDWKERR